MKKNIIALISGLILVTACSTEKNKSLESFEFNLTMDTVVVDAGNEIINLVYGLSSPALSKDRKYLYHYTHGQATFDKINLETLELEKTIKFEKDGPNSIGSYIGGYSITPENNFMIWSYGLYAIFSPTGEKIKDLELDKIANEELNGNGSFPIRLIEIPGKPNEIYGFFVQWNDNEYYLIKFDLENRSYKRISLPFPEKLNDFRMEIEYNGQAAGGYHPSSPRPIIVEDKIIFTTTAFNEAYIFDTAIDSLITKSWESSLTGNKNEAKLPKIAQMEEAEEHTRKFSESINFSMPQWDPISKQYVRLSHKTAFSEEKDENGRLTESSAIVYLTLMDKDLNIIKETILEGYTKTPPSHFYIDNTIWLFENIDDELGFVRMTIN
ncbi:DUF4221 domain-containing protein [Belliella sp. DSM 111904]|uniref:DUF4221 domain-containing protein n=1 Tax=Belliella filtrata TaxID=2923435 RepID=A0ABS9V2Y8_9BACT|nr:DUF4221 family protein [Belliella filtrata]MCH7410787.1 DUF4221 domain-containing protein [Belliella filtrata]